MTDHEQNSDAIELGAASEVTRGQAVFDTDISGGQLRYLAGIVDD